jgi:hypothetical protein
VLDRRLGRAFAVVAAVSIAHAVAIGLHAFAPGIP